MGDSHESHLQDPIDRYARNELTAREARALAQKSLDDPELFEDLTFQAVVKTALSNPSAAQELQQTPGATTRFPSRVPLLVAFVGATAAIVLLSLYFLRVTLPTHNEPSLVRNESRETVPPTPEPTLAFSAGAGQPVLLSGDLQSGLNPRDGAPVFRTREPDSRLPRPDGSIVSIEDGSAVVDLGSLDGVAKGSELRVFRDDRFDQLVGRLTVNTVFRERSRGQIPAGLELKVNDRVRVADATYLGALSQQVDAISAGGDRDAALKVAQTAVEWANNAKIVSSESRKVSAQLAALEYRAGLLDSAEIHYQANIDSFNSDPKAPRQEQTETFNNLAVLRLLRGDRDGAEKLLNEAISKSSSFETVYARSVNNLGVLAELRGDRSKATALYMDAIRVFASVPAASEQERRAVETNLSRLASSTR